MNEGQMEALKQVLRYGTAAALGGGALRTGMEVLRQANPRYEPPKVADPIMVTIPRPVPTPVPQLLAPHRVKELRGQVPEGMKAATFQETLAMFPGGQSAYDLLPNAQRLFGPENATAAEQVPGRMFAAVPVAAAGAGLGFYGADRLLRSADRRKARADLEEAQREYQDSVIGRAKTIQFPEKFGQEAIRLIEGGPVSDPIAVRIKTAIDRAHAASQTLSSIGLPPAIAAPAMPKPAIASIPGVGGGAKQPAPIASNSMPKSGPKTDAPSESKSAEIVDRLLSKRAEDPSQGQKFLTSLLYPGGWIGDALGGEAGGRAGMAANLAVAGTGAGIGGWLGYQHVRDKEKAELVRKSIRDIDRANASASAPPMIARIVPVHSPQTA